MLSLYYRAPGAGTKHRFFFPSVAAECTTPFAGSLLVLTASQQGDGEHEAGKHRVASSVTAMLQLMRFKKQGVGLIFQIIQLEDK